MGHQSKEAIHASTTRSPTHPSADLLVLVAPPDTGQVFDLVDVIENPTALKGNSTGVLNMQTGVRYRLTRRIADPTGQRVTISLADEAPRGARRP